MAGNSYFPPQSPLQAPPPSQFQAFSPPYPLSAQNCPSPQPWNRPPMCTSPPPTAPPTPYNPSAFTSPVLSPRDAYYPPRNPQYSQPRPQSSVGGYSGPPYSQPSGNGPPTPALTPSSGPSWPSHTGPSTSQSSFTPTSSTAQTPGYIPYNPSILSPRENTGSTTQYREQPSQRPVGQHFAPLPPTQPDPKQQSAPCNSQNSYGQPQVNAPPTPAYTPGPYGYGAPNSANADGPTTQYFPLQPPLQSTVYSQGPSVAQSSQGLANAPSTYVQTVSSATQAQPPQEGPPLQQAQSHDSTVFEMSAHPSPPPQVQSLFAPPQPVELQVTTFEEVQSRDQPTERAHPKPLPPQQLPSQVPPAPEARPQCPPAEEHQPLPPAPLQFQSQAPAPQHAGSHIPAEQVHNQNQVAEQVQSQPSPPQQAQGQWALAQQAPAQHNSAQQSQSQFPPLQEVQPHYQPAREAYTQFPPPQQVHSQPSPHQQVQPPPSQQVQPSPHEQVQPPPVQQNLSPPPPTQQVQPPPVEQGQSQPPPHQQGQFQPPPPEQLKSQYTPAGQAQSPPSGELSQYPPPPPYSQIYNPTNAPPVYNPSLFNQQPPALPQNVPTPSTYPNQTLPFQTSYPPEKQQYEQSLVQSFQVQLQVTSTSQQPQEKQQYQPNQLASSNQQPQSPLSGHQAQDKQQYEHNLVQSFQQQWHITPTGQYPQEEQRYYSYQAQHVQQPPQYSGFGQPPTQYPAMSQPQTQYPVIGPQQNLGGPFIQETPAIKAGFMPPPPPFVPFIAPQPDNMQETPAIKAGFMPPPPPFVPVVTPQPDNIHETPAIKAGFMPPPPPFVPVISPQLDKDDHKSSKTKRFIGDTLVGRVARSSVATVTSTVKMPSTLSPWGDNNPVTLPNVRYRDAVLFTTFAVVGGPLVDGASNVVTDVFGADALISEIISSGAGFVTGNLIVKFGVFQIVEQAIDKGVLEHVLPEVERTIRTTSVKSLQVSIKHKLMGVEADIRFVGTYPAASSSACEKGWFCPYLFASSRTPVIPRSNDFAVAQFFGPYVAADTALAHKILSELPCVIPLCDPNPTNQLPHSRLLIFFTGISPFRAGMWSTSRRPGCAQIIFHLLDGCPALVLPVAKAKTPVLAWSPWTLTQMQNGGASGGSGYSPEKHIGQITQWVAPLVEWPGLYPCVRDVSQAFDRTMWRVLSMMINGALAAPGGADKKVLGKIDAERAGIVMFRY